MIRAPGHFYVATILFLFVCLLPIASHEHDKFLPCEIRLQLIIDFPSLFLSASRSLGNFIYAAFLIQCFSIHNAMVENFNNP